MRPVVALAANKAGASRPLMPAQPATASHGNVEEQVYRELRDRFMSGVFLPGQVLTLRNLAADLGVSPMPVRQAVRCLIVEGALEILPNRTMQVPRMTRASSTTAARSMPARSVPEASLRTQSSSPVEIR